MGAYANPAKPFQFLVEIDGVEEFAVQKVTLPEITVGEVEHGAGNTTRKTAGMVTTGRCTIEKLVAGDGADVWAEVWTRLAQDPVTGGGALPQLAYRNIVIKRMDPSMTVVVQRYLLEDCFPVRYKPAELDRMQKEENIKETIELSVFRCYTLGA